MDATSPKLAIAIGVVIVVIFALALLRRPIIRAVLFTSEIIVLLLIILLTVVGAATGLAYSESIPFGLTGSNPEIVMPIFGAVIGFIVSAVFASFILTLTQIERNTKQMAAHLERVADRSLM
jgi:hypothetical protein